MNTTRFLNRRFVDMFFGYAAKPFNQPSLVVSSLVGGQLDFELVTSLREARARVALERFDAMGGKSGPLANQEEAT